MNADEMKRQAALAAIEHLPSGGIIGVGTGSTVNHFIDALAEVKGRFDGAVSSSEASTDRLREHGIDDARSLAAALAKVDYTAITASRRALRLGHPGMAISLNGIAQGYMTDRVTDLLGNEGFESAADLAAVHPASIEEAGGSRHYWLVVEDAQFGMRFIRRHQIGKNRVATVAESRIGLSRTQYPPQMQIVLCPIEDQ